MLGSRRGWFGGLMATGLILGGPGCDDLGQGAGDDLAGLPPARVTLEGFARRVAQRKKPAEMTAIAARSSRVLREMTSLERSALGRSSLRLRVDRPVIVEVATPEASEPPFWLADQRFRSTARLIHAADGTSFRLHQRRFPAGLIGLGLNALDRSATDHYAVFVRGVDGSNGPPVVGPVGADPVTARPAGRDVSPFEDVDRPMTDLPADLTTGLVLLTRQADRTDGALLPFGRAWKTRQPSSARPDQVVASFGLDPRRSLAVTWRTDPTVATSAARFVPESTVGRPSGAAVMFPGDTRTIRSDGLLNDPAILRHRVVAAGLQPGTRYAYAVGDGTAAGWSRWYSTATAPESPRDYSFLYLGDAQCELEKWGELAQAAHQARPDAGFMVLAGDLVDRGNERSNWDHFFLRAAGVFDAVPFMPAVGNHEYLDKGPEIYRNTFDLPKNGPEGIDPNLVYHFEFSDAFVAVLDSNLAIYDPTAASRQAAWLDRALSQTHATWKFVAFHHPIYASHPSRENPQLAQAWGAVFDKHHVDLVLTGHDHAYLRTVPMKAGSPVADPADGTVYVVAVSGEKFYGQVPRDYTARGLTQVATYQTIDIEVASRRLQYRSFTREGQQVDAFTIEKPATAANLPGHLAGSRE